MRLSCRRDDLRQYESRPGPVRLTDDTHMASVFTVPATFFGDQRKPY